MHHGAAQPAGLPKVRRERYLAKAGLAVRDAVDGSWWAGATLPDEAAEKLGIAGAGVTQHERHAAEREAWHDHLPRRLILGRCAANGELIAFEVAYSYDKAITAAARVLPGARWDRRRRVWVVPRSRPAAAALWQFARAYGFGIRADAQAETDDINAPAQRRDGGWRAR
jgi:hypothetical protein